jgi:hypothetical protein
VAERAALIVEFLETRPCADCGEADPLVREFDHVGDKEFGIAKGLRATAGSECSMRLRNATSFVQTVIVDEPPAVADSRARR